VKGEQDDMAKKSKTKATVPVAPRFYRYRFLMGAMVQNQLAQVVRTACIEEESLRIPDILTAWRGASSKMAQLAAREAGLAETISVEDIPETMRERARAIADDTLFQASFSDMPTTFAVVDIDQLVAPQREVNLDYVSEMRARIGGKSVEELFEFCVGPRTPPEIKMLQTAQNQITYTSRSMDLRFLGGYPKPLGNDDLRVAHIGGQPAMVVSLLVGFGASPINAYRVGRRVVLANGFHRIVAMRSAGISKAPIVLRTVTNPDIEFPEPFLELPRNYLLAHPRPVLVKDFFDDDLCVKVRLKLRQRVVKVSWGLDGSGVVPE
jgi:hypothetical protein